jgi:hypothetical protein
VSWKRELEVLVPNDLSKTGVGIGVEWTDPAHTDKNMSIWALSPCCGTSMCYQNGRDPDIICDGCHRTFKTFPNLKHKLIHAGPLFQVIQYNYTSLTIGEKAEIEHYIQNWTGLTGIGFSITL